VAAEQAKAVPAAARPAAPTDVPPASVPPKAERAGGVAAAKTEASKAAEKAVEKAVDVPLEPEGAPDVPALLKQAKKLLEKDKSDKVVLLCEKILKVQPKNVDALYDRGVALYNLERYDESVASLKGALAVRGGMSEAMLVLGDAYKMKGLTQEAIRWYRLVLKSAPVGDDASAARANLQALTGKP
jgi:tetratricopeptide (TPR) repeat protein